MTAMTTDGTLSRAALQARIDALPRVRLAHLPTPLDHCPRLGEALGGVDVWIKRDDLTGLAFGGNKTRQLEFLFADILAQGADTVVAGAYTQSNWCRQITGAAKKLGLEVALVLLHGEKGPALQGNLLLDVLMGADVTVVDLDSMERLTPVLEAKADELRRAGRRPYVVRPFGLDKLVLGAVGYVNGALELDAQLEAAGVEPDFLYLCGANMTPAGMALGLKALGRRTRLINVAPIVWSEPRSVDIARIASAAAARLDLDVRIAPDGHREPRRVHRGALRRGHRGRPRGDAPARRHRGHHPRPGLQRQSHGRADRPRPYAAASTKARRSCSCTPAARPRCSRTRPTWVCRRHACSRPDESAAPVTPTDAAAAPRGSQIAAIGTGGSGAGALMPEPAAHGEAASWRTGAVRSCKAQVSTHPSGASGSRT